MKPSPRSLRTNGVIILILCVATLYVCAIFVGDFEREKRRAWFEAVMIPISDGKVPLVVLDRQLVDRNGKCPYCGGRIIIVPTSPSGDRIVTYGTERRALNDHFYAYCPTPDTKGEMPFRFDGITTFLNDSEVSWFFSKRLETLTDRELEMENAYRVRVGKEAVRKRDTHY